MKQTAEKIAVLLGSEDVGLIRSILEEGFCTLTEVANEDDTMIGVKMTMPMLRDPVSMVYSVLTSAEKVLTDLYAEDDAFKTMQKGIQQWFDKKRELPEMDDDRLLEALDDPNFDRIFEKERTYFRLGKQGGISPVWLKRRLARLARKRNLINNKRYKELIK